MRLEIYYHLHFTVEKNWGIERLNYLSKVIGLASCRIKNWDQGNLDPGVHAFNYFTNKYF